MPSYRRPQILRAVTALAVLVSVLVCPVPALASIVKLSGTMPSWGDMPPLVGLLQRVSPNGQFVVFLADRETDGLLELYSVSITGGEPIKLNGPIHTGVSIEVYQISPDSRWVVYQAAPDVAGVKEIYSVPVDGSAAPVTLNLPLGATGTTGSFIISPDSRRLVYQAFPSGTDGGVYSVAITGPRSSSVKISLERVNAGAFIGPQYADLSVSADSRTVVYAGRRDSGQPYAIFSVPIDGPSSAVVIVSQGQPSRIFSGPGYQGYAITPDGSRIIYLADAETRSLTELYSTPIGGPASAAVKLNGPTTGGVQDFKISSDSGRVVYRMSPSQYAPLELYSVAAAGPAATGLRLHDPLAPGESVSAYEVSPAYNRVAYVITQGQATLGELYSTPLDGPTIGDPTLDFGPGTRIMFSPNGRYLVFDGGDGFDSVPATGPAQARVKLNDWAPQGIPENCQISPDSTRVVFYRNGQIFSVPLTGPSSARVRVDGPSVAGGQVFVGSLRITADSRWVVYVADQDVDETYELYASDAGYIPPPARVFLPLLHR